MEPIVYYNQQLKHNGITAYKVFENSSRRLSHKSLRNLLNYRNSITETLKDYINECNSKLDESDKSLVCDKALKALNDEDYKTFLIQTKLVRNLNSTQSRKLRTYCDKLSYYTQTRVFESKKSGKYSMKVAFLTLTAPETATDIQIVQAFNKFLDYLQRTANCNYVWKKELGEQNSKLHFHILVNNFIPYYIVSWKWKRLLLAEGVVWSKTIEGKDTESHYRIELPRNKKCVSKYISKYMSKAYDLPKKFGYVWGYSRILKDLKEQQIHEYDLPYDEIQAIKKANKVIVHDYVTHICCNLLKVEKIAPTIYDIFMEQYIRFSEAITLKQKFKYVESS